MVYIWLISRWYLVSYMGDCNGVGNSQTTHSSTKRQTLQCPPSPKSACQAIGQWNLGWHRILILSSETMNSLSTTWYYETCWFSRGQFKWYKLGLRSQFDPPKDAMLWFQVGVAHHRPIVIVENDRFQGLKRPLKQYQCFSHFSKF